MINKKEKRKLSFSRFTKFIGFLNLFYIILIATTSIPDTFLYSLAMILSLLNSTLLFIKVKKTKLLKSLRLLFRINVPIWIVVILLTYSKYQSLPFQIVAFALVFISFTSIITFILLVINRIIETGKLKLSIAVLILFIVLCFIISTLAYQRLVSEGSVISDAQCLKVNPLIIERKNSYVKSVNIILAKGNEEEYMGELKKYMNISDKYIKEQTKWLQEQKAYMNKWSFKFFLPEEVKTAAQLQYASREADMNSTKAIVDMFNTTDLNRQKEFIKVVIDQTKIANEADKKSELLWKTKPKFDLRVRFVKVHPSKCPKENLNIPNVQDFLSPPKPIQSGPITYNFDLYRVI